MTCYLLSQKLDWKRDNWAVRAWISTKNEEFIYFASTVDFGEWKYSPNSKLANFGDMVKRKNLSNIVSRKCLILENLSKKTFLEDSEASLALRNIERGVGRNCEKCEILLIYLILSNWPDSSVVVSCVWRTWIRLKCEQIQHLMLNLEKSTDSRKGAIFDIFNFVNICHFWFYNIQDWIYIKIFDGNRFSITFWIWNICCVNILELYLDQKTVVYWKLNSQAQLDCQLSTYHHFRKSSKFKFGAFLFYGVLSQTLESEDPVFVFL